MTQKNDTMTQEQPTFWMIPREIFFLNNTSFVEHRAFISYNIIYNGPIIISDSDFVNDIHIRNAILNEKFVKNLIESKYLQFACRTQNGRFIPFEDILGSIIKNGGHNIYISEDRLRQSEELLYVENNALLRPFSFVGAGERYTRETLRLFESLSNVGMYSQEFPPEYAQVMYETLQEYVNAGDVLTWSHFLPEKNLWATLAQRLSPKPLQEQHKKFAFEAVRGPYVTFLPEILKVNPTYSKEDSLGIDIWRGRHLLTEKELARRQIRSPQKKLSDYVAALATVSMEDIHKLRQSNECSAYEKACSEFSKNTTDVLSPLKAFLEYRRLVDDTIFKTLGKKSNQSATFVISLMERGKDLLQDTSLSKSWIKFCVMYGLDFFTFGLPSTLEFAYNKIYPRIQIGRASCRERV